MTYRIVTRDSNGELKVREYFSLDELEIRHTRVGSEDCSIDLRLRGLPVFQGLIGPMPDSGETARYETPEVFEKLTKEWSAPRRKRKLVNC